MLMNRVADIFFIIAICFCFIYFKTLNFTVIFSLIPYTYINISVLGCAIDLIDFISFCLIIGAVGKSAQLGLHT